MRDTHRMKEKYDLSLDSRQIVSLLIAGIVVMGAIFVLGVVVGKQLAGNVESAAAPDLLSALDARAEAMEDAQQDASLTFQDELTAKAPVEAVIPSVVLPPAPPVKVAEAPKAPEAPKEKEAPKAAPPAPAPKPVAEAVRPPEPPAPPAAPKVSPAAVTTRTAPLALKDAIARAQQTPKETTPTGAFTLQLSAYQKKDEAERFAGRLRDKGYAPYIIEATVPEKGTWYRVRMGRFGTKEAAQRYLTDFKRETQLSAFVAGAN